MSGVTRGSEHSWLLEVEERARRASLQEKILSDGVPLKSVTSPPQHVAKSGAQQNGGGKGEEDGDGSSSNERESDPSDDDKDDESSRAAARRNAKQNEAASSVSQPPAAAQLPAAAETIHAAPVGAVVIETPTAGAALADGLAAVRSAAQAYNESFQTLVHAEEDFVHDIDELIHEEPAARTTTITSGSGKEEERYGADARMQAETMPPPPLQTLQTPSWLNHVVESDSMIDLKVQSIVDELREAVKAKDKMIDVLRGELRRTELMLKEATRAHYTSPAKIRRQYGIC